MGAARAAKSIRLFTIPGQFEETMFDKVAVMEQWAEKGKASDEITGFYYA